MRLGMGKTPRHAAVTVGMGMAVALALMTPDLGGLRGAAAAAEVDRSTAAPAQVFRQWLPAALAGDARAQYELGRVYADGAVTREDMAEAARWYKMAADQGSARAQQDLAILYNKGLGVPQDYVQAYVWFDLAAVRFGTGQRYDRAAEMRDMMAAFLTPEQLAEAKRRSAEWQAKDQ